MKSKIDELTLLDLIRVSFEKLKISSHYTESRISYLADGSFLNSNLEIDLNAVGESSLLTALHNLNLGKLIQEFLIEISIEQSLLEDKYLFKAKCFGNKRYWTSDHLVKSCLMAIVYWYNNSKYIEYEKLEQFQSKIIEPEIYVETLKLPIMLLLKLKSLNIKTTKDFEKITNKEVIDELIKYNLM